MAEARFVHGDSVLQVDHTPAGAVAFGEVLLIGATPYIAHRAIVATELGAVAATGGVYEMVSDGSVDNPGARVYWNDTSKKVTETPAATHYHFGNTLPDQAASIDDDKVLIQHMPLGEIGPV